MSPATPGSRDSFAVFLSGLRRQDDDAWRELTERYTRRLVALARRNLDVRLRAKLSPEDVVQSVYRLLHQRLQNAPGSLRPQSWEHLWAMLALLAAGRCRNWFRHYFATQKRCAEGALPEGSGGEEDVRLEDFREPGPDESAQLAEEVRRLLPHLDDQTARIYWLGMLGFDDAEVAAELGVTEARVRFAREDCAAVLNRSLDAYEAP